MDQYSLSVRRQAAQNRISAAVVKMAGEEAAAKLEIQHKDFQIEAVLCLEAIADVLEQLPGTPPAAPAAKRGKV